MNNFNFHFSSKYSILRLNYFFYLQCMLFATYLMVFVRQYFWGANGFVAWVAASILSIIAAPIVVKNISEKSNYKSMHAHGYDINFFLIVMVPLTLLYLLRFVFPDSSWDIVNYHYINGERGLRGVPFIKGDFFYLSYSNPVSSMLTGIFRHILGHRLGTVINLLVLFWAALALNKILYKYVEISPLRYLLIITLLSFEGIIYQINNYWVDLLAIPLILEIVYLMAFVKVKNNSQYLVAALLMGMAVGLKLTNLYFILPAAIIFITQYLSKSNANLALRYSRLIIFMVFFFLPLIPYHVYIFNQTGNPIYPHFNWIFKSPYFELSKIFDETLGPANAIESFLWPLVMLFKSERLSPTPMYPLITAVGYLISLIVIGYCFVKKDKFSNEFKIICIAYFVFAFIWGVVSGDFRYVTVLELLAGVIIIIFVTVVLKEEYLRSGLLARHLIHSKYIFYTLILLCLSKIGFSLDRILKYEWAGRPTIFSNFQGYMNELQYVLRDYSLHEFLPTESKDIINQVEVWVSSSPVVSGYMVLLNPYLPYLDLHHLPKRGTGGLKKFNETIDSLGEKRYFSLIKVGTLGLSLGWSLDELTKGGFQLLQLKKLTVPYFSHSPEYNYDFMIVEVVPQKYEAEILKRISTAEINYMKSTLVQETWVNGCYSLEGLGKNSWRWCDKLASVSFKNYSNIPISISFDLNVQSGYSVNSNLYISGHSFKDTIKINDQLKNYNTSIELKAGEEYMVHFSTDAQRVNAPIDPRSLHLKFTELKYSSRPAGAKVLPTPRPKQGVNFKS